MQKARIIAAAILAFGGAAPAAIAHHSFAAFDRDTRVILTGTVREFQWTNPHAWIQVVVTDDAGNEKEWSIECGSPNMMARHGWKSRTLQAGDRIALVMHPLADGSPSGSLVSVTLADGQVLGPGGVPAPKTGNAPPPR
jgi:hypothetical protein